MKGKQFSEEFKHQDACIDDCCEKPVTGKLVKSKLLMSEKPVKGSGLLMSEKHVKGSGIPVKGSGFLISEKHVTGKLATSKLVKSGRTYSQVAKDLDEDGFKLAMIKKGKQ